MKKKRKMLEIEPKEVIKDPIYGYLEVFPHEDDIINTSTFQRLRRIKQLTSAHYVYPGTTHTRFSHSLGVMHLAGLFGEAVLVDLLRERIIDEEEFERNYLLLRLWGLLHDLGHGPFSHTFDDAVLYKYNKNHEKMAVEILQNDRELRKITEELSKTYKISQEDIAFIHETPEEPPSDLEPLRRGRQKIKKTIDLKITLRDIIKGIYSADIMDFLLRDAYYTGAGYVNFDWRRLILASHVQNGNIVLEKRAEDALVAFITSRFFMFRTTYYHRTARCFDKITYDFLRNAEEELKHWVTNVTKYVELDENSIFWLIEGEGSHERKWLEPYSSLQMY